MRGKRDEDAFKGFGLLFCCFDCVMRVVYGWKAGRDVLVLVLSLSR